MDNLDFNYFCSSCNKNNEYKKANCFTQYRIKQYKTGDYLAFKGDRVKELSILNSGSVDTIIILGSGISYTSKFHKAPYSFGALAIFAKENIYRADIVAREDCTVITVSKDVIENQMLKCKTFLRNFIAYNTSKFDLFTEHLTILTHKNLKAKLAYYIFSTSENGNFKFDKNLEALATYLCVERPSLSRAISQLVDNNIITYSRGSGKITNPNALKNLLA